MTSIAITNTRRAAELHSGVPADWYYQSMKRNLLQRFWHQSRFSVVGELVERESGARILDLGSADGMFTNVVLKKSNAKQIVGMDVLRSSVDWANKHWKSKRVSFQTGDAHDLQFKAKSFDGVFALEIMEHVFEPEKVFLEVKRVLKKGGYFVVLVPTDNLLFSIIWWFVTKFWWAKIWDETHVQSFNSKNTLAGALRKTGFKVEVDKKFLLGMLNVVKVRKVN